VKSTSTAVGWAPLPTLAVAWACLAQVLSFRGVAIWVAGGSLLVLVAMRALLRAGRSALGLTAGIILTLGLAFLADAYGGDSSGPLARATLLACGLTAASVAMAFTRYRFALLVPSLALLGSALGLGAAGRSGAWVGLWVVAAAVTAAMLGPYRDRELAGRERVVPFALLAGTAGFIAIAALLFTTPLLGTAWTIPGAGSAEAGVAPAIAATSQTPIVVVPPPETSSETIATNTPWLLLIVIGLLLAFALFLVWLVVRRTLHWIRWRTLRRRLSRGTPEQRVVGAWTWLRLRLAMWGDPLPKSASPDVAVEWALAHDDSALAIVARLTAQVAFNPEGTMSMPDSALAWEQALAADRRRRGSWIRLGKPQS
jgi:hypothetical protein